MPKIKGYRIIKENARLGCWRISCRRCDGALIVGGGNPAMDAIDWALDHNLTHSKKRKEAT